MRRLLLYNLVCLLVSAVAVIGNDCPSKCTCDTSGSSGIFAKCSAFDGKQKFGLQINYLDLSNIPKSSRLVLTRHIFADADLKRVSSIKIVNSALKDIDVNAFHGLHNLNELNLTGNHLGLLEPDMFVNNTHLEKLSLSKNQLQNMQVENSPYTEYFLNIPSLQELDLSDCSLSHLLPTTFRKLTTLYYVNLASNQLTDIPKETFAPLIDLTELDLSNNKLSQLRSDMFEQNLELAALNLQNNPLSSLKDVSIESLQRLDLSSCKFSTIDADTFAGFPDIRDLNLIGNVITSIDSNAFKNMKRLHYLDLSNNKLNGPLPGDIFINNFQIETVRMINNTQMKSLPDSGFQGEFSELYLLDVSRCGLTHLDEDSLKQMNRVSQLYLSGNDLQYVKPNVLSTRVTILDLSENKIAHLDQVSFPSGSSLRKLYLSGNPLKKLSPGYFVNTPRLTRLDLRACELKQMWDVNDSEFQPLKVLGYLNVADNKINTITMKDLKYIDHVQTLVLSGNPLSCNSDFKKVAKFLTGNGVASSDATEQKQLEEIRSEDSTDTAPRRDHLGWETMMNKICYKGSLINPVQKQDEYTNEDPDTTLDSIEEIDNEEIYFITTHDPDRALDYFPEDIHKEPVKHTKTNYMWPIIIVSLSAFSIILALVVLAALLLRWTRQKNSYRNKIVRRHSICNTPKLKRGGSTTVYQQLYEDPHSPTTPVMTTKHQEHLNEQRTYTFPEKETNETTNIATAQPTNHASYLSSPFHHSNIVPDSV